MLLLFKMQLLINVLQFLLQHGEQSVPSVSRPSISLFQFPWAHLYLTFYELDHS